MGGGTWRATVHGVASAGQVTLLLVHFISWLCWAFAAVCGLSPAAVSGALLFLTVLELLVAVASLVAEHRF